MYPSFNARAVGFSVSAEETIAAASAAGFAGVDLMVRDVVESGVDPETLRSRMDDLGLRGGAWPLPVDWRGDLPRFEHDLRELPRCAKTAAILGLTRTGTWVMPETPARPNSKSARAAHIAQVVDFHRERLGAVARILNDHGCRLGLEVIGVRSSRTGRGWPFVRSLAELGARLGTLLEEEPSVGILLDVWHRYAAGETAEAGLAWGTDRIVWVHVADLPGSSSPDRRAMVDAVRGLPGENGAIDARNDLCRLAEEGYHGPVIAEPLARCRTLTGLNLEETAQRAALALRSVWPATTPF